MEIKSKINFYKNLSTNIKFRNNKCNKEAIISIIKLIKEKDYKLFKDSKYENFNNFKKINTKNYNFFNKRKCIKIKKTISSINNIIYLKNYLQFINASYIRNKNNFKKFIKNDLYLKKINDEFENINNYKYKIDLINFTKLPTYIIKNNKTQWYKFNKDLYLEKFKSEYIIIFNALLKILDKKWDLNIEYIQDNILNLLKLVIESFNIYWIFSMLFKLINIFKNFFNHEKCLEIIIKIDFILHYYYDNNLLAKFYLKIIQLLIKINNFKLALVFNVKLFFLSLIMKSKNKELLSYYYLSKILFNLDKQKLSKFYHDKYLYCNLEDISNKFILFKCKEFKDYLNENYCKINNNFYNFEKYLSIMEILKEDFISIPFFKTKKFDVFINKYITTYKKDLEFIEYLSAKTFKKKKILIKKSKSFDIKINNKNKLLTHLNHNKNSYNFFNKINSNNIYKSSFIKNKILMNEKLYSSKISKNILIIFYNIYNSLIKKN